MTPQGEEAAVGVVVVVFGQDESELASIAAAVGSFADPVRRLYLVNNEPGRTVEAPPAGGVDVVVVESGTNRGWTGGVNLGVDRAARDGCGRALLLNTDIEVLASDLIGRLGRALDDPSCAFASPTMVCRPEHELIWYRGASVHQPGFVVRHDGIGEPLAGPPALAGPVEVGCSAAMLVDTAAFLDLGGFDETLFMYYEDVDLAIRARERGLETFLVDEVMVAHHRARQRRGKLQSYYFGRNPLLLVAKHRPPPFRRDVLAHLLRCAAFATRCDSPAALVALGRGLFDGLGALGR